MPHPVVRNRRQPFSIANPLGYPDTIPGLTNLWKADSLTTLNDGDLISSWPDAKAGNILSAAGTARPTFKTNIFGNKPVARFDGTANTMGMSSTITLSITTGFTVIACWAGNGGAGTRYLLSRTGAGAGGIRVDEPLAQWFEYDGVVFPSSNPSGGTGTNAFVGGFRYTTTAKFRQNKSSLGDTQGALTLDIGINTLGSFQGLIQFFLGDLAEIMFYNNALSDSVCDGIYDNYLKLKYTTLP
jgi:hypothetical protein